MTEAYRPSNLCEALEVRKGVGALPFAGGTDLMVKHRRGAGVLPSFGKPLLLLDHCEGLRGIAKRGSDLEIGAMTTLAELAASPLAHEVLREIISLMGGPGIRNVATLGGNICNASPAGDTLPFLYAFDASVRLVSAGGERIVPVGDFITGPGATCLAPDELLAAVLVPMWKPTTGLYRKVGTRKANALTKVSIAAFADLEGVGGGGNPSRMVSRVRIALGAVGPTVVRLKAVEQMLAGVEISRLVSRELRDQIKRAAGEQVRPIDDQRSTAQYRCTVAVDLVDAFVEKIRAG